MAQYAWLNSSLGVWHLVLEDDDHPLRYWSNMDSALAELGLGPDPHCPESCNEAIQTGY